MLRAELTGYAGYVSDVTVSLFHMSAPAGRRWR